MCASSNLMKKKHLNNIFIKIFSIVLHCLLLIIQTNHLFLKTKLYIYLLNFLKPKKTSFFSGQGQGPGKRREVVSKCAPGPGFHLSIKYYIYFLYMFPMFSHAPIFVLNVSYIVLYVSILFSMCTI